MDFFTEAVNVLADIVRALSCPDFSRRMEGNVSGEGKGSGYPADAD